MKKYIVPIFTSEYFVTVLIGKREEICKEGAKIAEETLDKFTKEFNGRGQAQNLLPKWKYPLIIVDWDLPAHIAFSTLAHEAVHALDYISHYLGMEDMSGEFVAHGVAEIMRTVTKDILSKKK